MKLQLLNEKWIIWLHMMCKREAPVRNGLCTLEILMLDHQLSYLQGKSVCMALSGVDCQFLLAEGRNLTKTKVAQNVKKGILIST